jgi:hypothetical protein
MLRRDWDDLAAGQKGDWYFSRENTHITIRWGEGKYEVVTIPISTGTKQANFWLWDENKDAPTIQPSIRILGGDGQPDVWHGYLRHGRIETA